MFGAGGGEVICRLHMLIFSRSPLSLGFLGCSCAWLSPTQRPYPRCLRSTPKPPGTGSGVPFPDLSCHPSPYLRSRQPTWSALPTANNETAAGEAVTAMAVQHLFYLWFSLHRKFQDLWGFSCGGGVEERGLVLRKVGPSEISALSPPTMQRNLGWVFSGDALMPPLFGCLSALM